MQLQPDSEIFILNLVLNLVFALSSLLFARWVQKRKRRDKANGFHTLFAGTLAAYGLFFFGNAMLDLGLNLFFDRLAEWLPVLRLLQLGISVLLLFYLSRLAKFYDIQVKDLL